MTVETSLWMRFPDGSGFRPVDTVSSFAWALEENAFGKLVASGPLNDDADATLFRLDNRLEVYRSVDGNPAYLEGMTQFMLRYWSFYRDAAGRQYWEIEAYTPEYLLDGRFVDYPASTATKTNSNSTKTEPADDMLKSILYENMGGGALAARRCSFVTIQDDLSGGYTLTKSFSRRNLYELFQEIAAASLADGVYLGYGFLPDSDGANLSFYTWIGQRGSDRRADSGNPLVLSYAAGNLTEPRITFDHRTERTFVRAGGQGEGAARVTASATDTERAGASPFNWREMFIDGRQTSSITVLTSDAKSALEQSRPVRGFYGKFLDNQTTRYGLDLNFGDLVTAEYLGYQFDCRIYRVSGACSAAGENLTVELRSEGFE